MANGDRQEATVVTTDLDQIPSASNPSTSEESALLERATESIKSKLTNLATGEEGEADLEDERSPEEEQGKTTEEQKEQEEAEEPEAKSEEEQEEEPPSEEKEEEEEEPPPEEGGEEPEEELLDVIEIDGEQYDYNTLKELIEAGKDPRAAIRKHQERVRGFAEDRKRFYEQMAQVVEERRRLAEEIQRRRELEQQLAQYRQQSAQQAIQQLPELLAEDPQKAAQLLAQNLKEMILAELNPAANAAAPSQPPTTSSVPAQAVNPPDTSEQALARAADEWWNSHEEFGERLSDEDRDKFMESVVKELLPYKGKVTPEMLQVAMTGQLREWTLREATQEATKEIEQASRNAAEAERRKIKRLRKATRTQVAAQSASGGAPTAQTLERSRYIARVRKAAEENDMAAFDRLLRERVKAESGRRRR